MIFRLTSSKYRERSDKVVVYTLTLQYLDFDGSRTGFVTVTRDVEPFVGAVPISNLEYFPLDRHPSFQVLQQELIQRGERILRLQGQHFKEYRGHGLSSDEMKRFTVSGRIMIDAAGYERLEPVNSIVPRIRNAVDTKSASAAEKMLLNPILYGFSFDDKTWGAFAESSIYDVVWNESAIDMLVLPPEKKEFIQVVVKAHGSGEHAARFDDFIRNKGKGLLGLLAGPPGVGKTMTAEAVAEIAHRPLYMISSGELGDTSASIQSGLSKLMKLSEMWDVVVLLDEADVFLSERNNVDLSRNAITSIFLRHLEYFQGIMMLTTNRVKSLDQAFQSRIHFCLDYPDLTFDARRMIWSNFIQKASQDIEVTLQDEDMNKLAQQALNGRQIKNVVGLCKSVGGVPRSLPKKNLSMG
ncbi:hypothetical protein INS49_013568 [Diaporthe citri]|uniref:uncharacterized protein n=1 Tax=Diaporthe citri TaxID=83186 RepID=UPI001C81E5B5|nr:uncharacterized protein INS49_013568 [Diaporthe citri]KAG6357689.1 hypothetical protein INS49_013568 [Diaporthe citri]